MGNNNLLPQIIQHKKRLTFVNGIPHPVLEQAQKCGGDKSDALYFQKLSAF
jgi:hypothetical protein